MLRHPKALSEKWTVVFWLKASKPFILRSGDIFAQRGSRLGFSDRTVLAEPSLWPILSNLL